MKTVHVENVINQSSSMVERFIRNKRTGQDHRWYLCGPDPTVQAMRDTQSDFPEADVYKEGDPLELVTLREVVVTTETTEKLPVLENKMKRVFVIEWPDECDPMWLRGGNECGSMWMHKDNLLSCLKSDQHVGSAAEIKVTDVTDELLSTFRGMEDPPDFLSPRSSVDEKFPGEPK